MDGVLTDSEPLINAAAVAMFRERGLTVQPADFLPFVGTGENRYIGGVAEKYGFPLDLEAAKARTYQIYLELVPTQLHAFPGAVDLVQHCRAAGLKVAVASSADRIKIEANLRQIGLPPEQWDAIVCAEDVVHKKPAPDIFLAAAHKLDLEPNQCVVVEDAVNGVRAAKAAGMRCVAVAQSFPPEQLVEADLVRLRIADVTLADLQGTLPASDPPAGGQEQHGPPGGGQSVPPLLDAGGDSPRAPGLPVVLPPRLVPPTPARAEVPASPPRPWGFWATSFLGLFIAIATLVAQVVAVWPLIYWLNRRGIPARFSDDNGFLLSVASIAGLPVSTLFCVAFARARRGMSARDYLGLRTVPAGQVLRWLVALLVLVGVSDCMTWLAGRPIVVPFMIETFQTAGSVALLWVAIVVAAPVAEEVFFRGFLFAGFAASPLGPVGAALLTSIAWGFIHFQYDFYGRSLIFVSGLLLGWARWRTSSVTVPILMHALMNAVSLIETGIVVDRLPDPPTPGTVLV